MESGKIMSTLNGNFTNALHKHRIYFIDDIPESLLKQVFMTGDTTDLENYLNGNPVFCCRELEHLQEIEAIPYTL